MKLFKFTAKSPTSNGCPTCNVCGTSTCPSYPNCSTAPSCIYTPCCYQTNPCPIYPTCIPSCHIPFSYQQNNSCCYPNPCCFSASPGYVKNYCLYPSTCCYSYPPQNQQNWCCPINTGCNTPCSRGVACCNAPPSRVPPPPPSLPTPPKPSLPPQQSYYAPMFPRGLPMKGFPYLYPPYMNLTPSPGNGAPINAAPRPNGVAT